MKCKASLLFLLCAFLAGSPDAAADQTFAGKASLTVRVHDSWPAVMVGAQPLRLDVFNHGAKRSIRFVVKPRYGAGTKVTKTIEIEERTGATVTLPLQVSGNSELAIFADGISVYDSIGLSFVRRSSGVGQPTVIVSQQRVPSDLVLRALQVTFSGSGGTTDLDDEIAIIRPADLPTTWKGYTGLGILFVESTALREIPSRTREEIWKWVAVGGSVAVYNSNVLTREELPRLLPAPGVPGLTEALDAGKKSEETVRLSYMLGDIYLWPKNPSRDEYQAENDWVELFRATGTASLQRIYRSPGFSASPEWNPYDYSRSFGPYGYEEGTSKSRYGQMILPGLQDGFRVPGVGNPPLGLFWLAILAFVAVIGPLNFILLWRKRRQTLLVLTAPALAIGVILIMAAAAILGDGLALRVVPRSITFLDMKNHIAATQGQMFLYAGLAPGDGFNFGEDATLMVNTYDYRLSPRRYREKDEAEPRSVNLTNGDSYRSGWLKSRTHTFLATVSIAAARERIIFKRQGGEITATNALGVDIDEIALLDKDGRVFLAHAVEKGKTVTLTPPSSNAKDRSLDGALTLLDMCRQDNGSEKLVRNAFFCRTTESPFLKTGLEEFEAQNGLHLIVGDVVWE